MATTHYLIGRVTVGSGGAASIDFSNIPQTYTDLVLKISGRFNYASGLNSNIGIKYNGSSSNLSRRTVYGTGSAAGSNSGNDGFIGDANAAQSTSSTFGNCEVYIPNYTGSTYKSYSSDTVYENNGTTAWSYGVAGLWSNTAAITSISLYDIFNSSNWIQYSSVSLYGVSATGDSTKVPYASGGDVITTDGTYWYHAFKSSGTFTPLKSLSADVLVVGGGGAGGAQVAGGGGGAGGIQYYSSQSLTAQGYTVTVGAGGSAAAGSSSQFGSLTVATGGGRGNATGGSGGTSGTAQSNAGGTGNGSNKAGGGGGAGAVGSNSGTDPGNGGVGSSTYSSWGSATGTGQLVSSTYYYAGGGGGGRSDLNTTKGTGGSGGGGNGGTPYAIPVAGTANTGGGGGGGRDNEDGYAGGSGIVIVRYPV